MRIVEVAASAGLEVVHEVAQLISRRVFVRPYDPGPVPPLVLGFLTGLLLEVFVHGGGGFAAGAHGEDDGCGAGDDVAAGVDAGAAGGAGGGVGGDAAVGVGGQAVGGAGDEGVGVGAEGDDDEVGVDGEF